MAITISEYTFLSILAQRNILPKNPSVLELGEQHWHGDVPIEFLKEDISNSLQDEQKKKILLDRIAQIVQLKDKKKNFDLVKIAYQFFLGYKSIAAIDLHGTDDALKLDLNEPVNLHQSFDIVINCGTGEHVFNIYQFFKTVHDITNQDGIMIHVTPFIGWVNHGFFNIQPTLYWDLAQYNDYEILACFIQPNATSLTEFSDREGATGYLQSLENQGETIKNSNLYIAMCKKQCQSFKVPIQGFFQVSKESYWDLMVTDISKDSPLFEEFNLRETNLIVFPDWNQSEDTIIEYLEDIIQAIKDHLNQQKVTLLISTIGFNNAAIDLNIILSSIMLNCISDFENLDKDKGLDISIVNDLDAHDWKVLSVNTQYRIISLLHGIDDIEVVKNNLISTIPTCELGNLANLVTVENAL